MLVWFGTVIVRCRGTCGMLWAGGSDEYGAVPIPAGLGVADSE